ncbi:MAG: hypothetical protein GEU71_06910 [Actinobacteria bacterium]|jgi:hypothetical protein|nr:hypothetical protein [Actinomycetota bacterium]
MSRRVRNLAITAAAPLVAIVLIWGFLGSDRPPRAAPPAPKPANSTPAAEAPEPREDGVSERLYSIALYRLNGLSPAALPGTGLEIWVSWSEKVLDEPKLQRLIRRVTLEGIEVGPSPEAPSIVTLRVPVKEIPNLIWAEFFGELAVAARPD